MRHRKSGRKLGRNASHRKAMLRNMACSLILSIRGSGDNAGKAKIGGRITTTVEKAKELRPIVEKLITIAKKAEQSVVASKSFAASASRNSVEWKQWRNSISWNQWNTAISPAVALRRRAFAALRNREAVDTLFKDLAQRFLHRQGGYIRIIRLAAFRLGDAGKTALIEFVGERDRRPRQQASPSVRQGATAMD